MFRFILFVLLIASATLLSAADPAQREWKDANGKVLAQGEFVSLMDGEVCLMTPQGTGKTIPLKDLCDEDKKFAQNNGEDLNRITGSLPETEEIGAKTPPKKPQTLPAMNGETRSAPSNPDVDVQGSDIISESGSGDIQRKAQDESEKYTGQKRVVMFDFESLWDKDRASDYGGIMGNLFWMKLNREKGFIIPESMIDVRNVCETKSIYPNPDTPLPQVKEWVTKVFNADIGIWGKIERVDADVMEIYDFWLKIVDFSGETPQVIYEVSRVRTEAIAEVTGLYAKAALEKLYDRQPRTIKENALREDNWIKNPNLIEGGDFEKIVNGVPVGWESRCGQHREPVGRIVKAVADADKAGNHYIHLDADAETATTYGLMYYSKPFPIEEGATYRIDYRYRLHGIGGIVFIKCYDTIDTAFRPTADTLKEGFDDKLGQQTREVYRSQQKVYGSGKWIQHSQEFTPRHTRFSPKFGRVMLYCYGAGAGTMDCDDFVLKKVKEADPEELRAKVLRHSQDSKVTLKEMEENERRASETRRKNQRERPATPPK